MLLLPGHRLRTRTSGIRLYIDGNLEADSKEPVPSPFLQMLLSVGYTDLEGTLLMDIAELNIHDRALETTEIIRHFKWRLHRTRSRAANSLACLVEAFCRKSDGSCKENMAAKHTTKLPVVYRILQPNVSKSTIRFQNLQKDLTHPKFSK